MNERIDKLMVKAGTYFSGEGVVYDTFDPKKFAELIVQECCQVVESRYKYSNGTPVSFWQMSQDVQDLLKKHFGVEE